MKKLIRWQLVLTYVVTLIICLGLFCIAAYANSDNITVIVDGRVIELEQAPIIHEGQVMVPILPIADAMGWTVGANDVGIYFQRNGDIEIIPSRLFYTYYKTIVGLTDGELYIRHHDTLGGFDTHHFKHGHFPLKSNEVCPGEKLCGMLDEEHAHSLTVKPFIHNSRMLMALEDLALSIYATFEWDGDTRTVIFTTGELPYYDGHGLNEEYGAWLIERTFEAHKQHGAVEPLNVQAMPVLSGDEALRAFEAEVIRLVNVIRAEEGLQLLSSEAELDTAAQIRAEELKTKLSHTRPCGSPASSMLDNLAYAYGGENILLNSMRQSPEMAATAAISIWMGNDGHRANILNSELRFIGVGAEHGDERDILYAVQLFAK